MAQIICENVTLAYDSKTVLKDVSFCVNQGDYLCILGKNGSGKTTLMRALLGLHQISGGRLIKSKDATSKKIGYLPQQTQLSRDFPATVGEVVLSGCRHRIFHTNHCKNHADKCMQKLEISDLKNRSFKELSGGQQKRVLLARALCGAESVLLVDEPTASLDSEATESFYRILQKLNKQDGITIIMISHDTECLRFASHVLYLDDTVFFGTKDEFLQRGGERE